MGIGHIDEITAQIRAVGGEQSRARERQRSLYEFGIDQLIGDALEPVRRLARIADGTATEIKRARKAMDEANEAVRPAAALCDITTATRLKAGELPIDVWVDPEPLLVRLPPPLTGDMLTVKGETFATP